VDPEFGYSTTHQFNILGNCPVMSLPSGFAATGVPTGIQIVGRTFDNASVHRAAPAYERARGRLVWIGGLSPEDLSTKIRRGRGAGGIRRQAGSGRRSR
jgi:Asp-tRNA(Asn)/Glu-tRNA(Gln) amidotransferase A subunit family amidase